MKELNKTGRAGWILIIKLILTLAVVGAIYMITDNIIAGILG